jgi:hypothetical protein
MAAVRSPEDLFVRMPSGDPHRVLAWVSPLGHSVRHFLALGAKHTGLPAVLLAAIVLVVSFRIARFAARFAVQVAVVATLLVFATRLGWLRW